MSGMDAEAHRELWSLIDQIPEEDRRTIADLSEEQAILLYHGLGTWIRNLVRSGELTALFRWSCAQATGDDESLNARAWPIILEVWRALKSPASEQSSKQENSTTDGHR